MVLLVYLNFSLSPLNEKVPAAREAWQLFKIIMPKMACHHINSPHFLFLTHLWRACYGPGIVLSTWHMRPHFTRNCFVARRTQMQQEAGPWEVSASFISHRETVSIKCRASLAREKVAALIVSSTALRPTLTQGQAWGMAFQGSTCLGTVLQLMLIFFFFSKSLFKF